MSQRTFRHSLLLVAATGALSCFGCGSDQKTTNTPDDVPAAEPPATTPQPGDSAMPVPESGPATSPPPQSSTDPQSGNDPQPGNSTADANDSKGSSDAQLDEDQVAEVTRLVNDAEIKQAKLAQSKAQSGAVKRFADEMIRDHGQAEASGKQACRQLDLTPAESDTSRKLQSATQQTLSELQSTQPADFDAAYMKSQVEEHQQVLSTIDDKLMPAAKDQKLADSLKNLREKVADHLSQAKSLRSQLQHGGH